MNRYMVSKGFQAISYFDESSRDEKMALIPIYFFDIHAEDLLMARYMCEMMKIGKERKDFFIMEIEEDPNFEVDTKNYYENHILN